MSIAIAEFGKVAIGTPDFSKQSLQGLTQGLGSAGVLTNPGVSFFGAALSVGMAKAAVNIGPPLAIPGLALPLSLWVDGITQLNGIVNVYGNINQFALKTAFGAHIANSLGIKNGVDLKNALDIKNTVTVSNGVTVAAAPVTAPVFLGGDISATTGINPATALAIASRKPFDIPHPTKKDHRLRHVCLEGPESGVYFRGRLTGKNVIDLPDYWQGLVDPETITVNLTQIRTSQDLIVERIESGKKIIIKSGSGTTIDCYYIIHAERSDDEKLIVEYKGTSSDDYPGNNSIYSINK